MLFKHKQVIESINHLALIQSYISYHNSSI